MGEGSRRRISPRLLFCAERTFRLALTRFRMASSPPTQTSWSGLFRPSSHQPLAVRAESWILGPSPRMTVLALHSTQTSAPQTSPSTAARAPPPRRSLLSRYATTHLPPRTPSAAKRCPHHCHPARTAAGRPAWVMPVPWCVFRIDERFPRTHPHPDPVEGRLHIPVLWFVPSEHVRGQAGSPRVGASCLRVHRNPKGSSTLARKACLQSQALANGRQPAAYVRHM